MTGKSSRSEGIRQMFSLVDGFEGNRTGPDFAVSRTCPVCGSSGTRPVLEFQAFQFFTDDAQKAKRTNVCHVQCTTCFALYMNPCYTEAAYDTLFNEATRSCASTHGRGREQVDWLAEHGLIKAGKVLMDVGCHEGQLIADLPPDVAAVGVDIDAVAIGRARAAMPQPKWTFICADLTKFDYDGQVNVITMFHVLEHLPKPIDVLVKLRKISTPHTRLVVEVPILEKAAINDVCGFLSIQHLTHFSVRSLTNTLAQAGWRVVSGTAVPDYNGYRIIAEPLDSASVEAGDPADVGRLYDYLGTWYEALAQASKKLQAVGNVEQCVVWGAGMHTEYLYHLTPVFRLKTEQRFLLVDSDPLKQGRSWRGIPIVNPNEAADLDWDNTMLLVSSYSSQDEIADAAVGMGVPENRIAKIYDYAYIY